MKQAIDSRETAKTQTRYDRIAPVYDVMEWVTKAAAFEKWRPKLWSLVPAGRILEVGVGTGKNLAYHPDRAEVVGLDLSPRMLAQARRKAEKMYYEIELYQMDVQQLDFAENSFDGAVTTFVFCSVPDAEQGLRELTRLHWQSDGLVRPAGGSADGASHQPPHGRDSRAGPVWSWSRWKNWLL